MLQIKLLLLFLKCKYSIGFPVLLISALASFPGPFKPVQNIVGVVVNVVIVGAVVNVVIVGVVVNVVIVGVVVNVVIEGHVTALRKIHKDSWLG